VSYDAEIALKRAHAQGMNLYEQHTPDRIIRYRQIDEAATARQAALRADVLAHRREKRTVDRAWLERCRARLAPPIPSAPRWSRAEIVSARIQTVVQLGGAPWL
jgi:hypothetical protein